MEPRLALTARFWFAAAAGSMLYLRPANLDFCSAYAGTADRNDPAAVCASAAAAPGVPFHPACTMASTFEHDTTTE